MVMVQQLMMTVRNRLSVAVQFALTVTKLVAITSLVLFAYTKHELAEQFA